MIFFVVITVGLLAMMSAFLILREEILVSEFPDTKLYKVCLLF